MTNLPVWVRSKTKSIKATKNITFAGLFCGCGGLDLGAMIAGLEPIYSADNDPVAVETYRQNLGPHIECVDLAKSRIPKNSRHVDLILGGPPCQGFSSAGPKLKDDPRNLLWQSYLDYVNSWEPKVFLLENVPGFQKEFKNFATEAEKFLGGRYKIFSRRFITQYYGVPQFRDRLIIQGVRTDVASGPSWPKPTSEEIFSYRKDFATAISMETALADLGPADLDNSTFNDHKSVPLSVSDRFIAEHIPNGGSLKDIPDLWLPDTYAGRERTNGGWTWYYRKPQPNLPARGVIASIRPIYATILAPDVSISKAGADWRWEPIKAGDFTDKNGYYSSPVKQRRLTVRECARLQTFPDWFSFTGNALQMHRQIGNAVPVEFARRLCSAVIDLIEYGNEGIAEAIQGELF